MRQIPKKRCNRVIVIHTDKGADPRDLQDFLLERGKAPTQLMFCHVERTNKDFQVQPDILKHGSYLEYDTVGRLTYHSDEHEIELIKAVAKTGYEDQILNFQSCPPLFG